METSPCLVGELMSSVFRFKDDPTIPDHLPDGNGTYFRVNADFLHLPLGKKKNTKDYQPQAGLGGGFKYFLCSPLLGEDSHFD